MDIHSLQLSHLTQIKNFSSDYSVLEEDYIVSRISKDNLPPQDQAKPMRINGLTLVLCLDGHFSIDINLDHYTVESNSILAIGPNSIIRFDEGDYSPTNAYLLFVSVNFMKDINIDINTLNITHIPNKRSPVVSLHESEVTLIRKYLDMIHLNTTHNKTPLYKRNISRCIMASLVYQMMQIAENHNDSENIDTDKQVSRRLNYVRDFMTLVQKHHSQERSVGFYAEKLFISAKYLSLIIKEATGRSAAEWIDDYVILEAKNLLRYSGKNIQQVAYELNFTNQSSFGKYFKNLTGMSPSEFQKS